jgi:hypothetical protein
MIPNQHCVVVAGAATAEGANADKRRRDMMRMVGAGIFLGLAALLPAQDAAAQDPLAGAGRGGGAVGGAVMGATTGAVIAAEAQQRSTGYYWWRGGCFYRYPNGSWLQVQPGYCSY